MTVLEYMLAFGIGLIVAAFVVGLMAFIALIIEGAFHR